MAPARTNHPSALEQQWGIQLAGIILTNGENAVELRYTIVAPEKMALVTLSNASPFLIDKASGAKLGMITLPEQGTALPGAKARTIRRMMHQAGQFPPAPSRVIAGRTYSLQIPNWDGTLKSGSKVAFVLGNCRIDDLTVE